MRRFVPIFLASVLTLPTLAQAQSSLLQRARRDLATYDLSGDRTVNMIAELGEYLREHSEPTAEVREARFIRAMAAADMLLLFHHRQDPHIEQRVAQSFGVTPDRLPQAIELELESLELGVYEQAARDAHGAMEHLLGHDEEWMSQHGARRDVLFLAKAREAAMSEDPVAGLAELGVDPCRESCSQPYSYFDETGRAAIAAVEEAFQAMERLRHQASQGDPFAHAVMVGLPPDDEAFQSLELRPSPVVTNALTLTSSGARAQQSHPDLVLAVHEHEVRYGWVPRVRFSSGTTEVVSSGEPMLPNVATITLPNELRPHVAPLDEVTDALAQLNEAEHVAIGGGDDAPAHVLARVLLSADRAGIQPESLVGADEQGRLRGVSLMAARSAGNVAVNVFVRLGGHTVSGRLSPRVELPRVRTEEGLAFDYASLAQRVPRNRSTAVSFMHTVPMHALTKTIFHVAPEQRPVSLLLP